MHNYFNRYKICIIGTQIHSRSSFRIIKDWCINLPNHFWICLSAEHIKNTSICLVFNKSISGKIHWTFANNCDRSLIFITHFVTKCSSSSTILHFLHILRWDGTIGLEYLPRSISKIWELARSFVMTVRWTFTLNKYGSRPQLDLNRRYVLKSGLSWALRPSCHSLTKCSFTWDWQCILNSTVLPDIRTPYVCAISWTFDIHVSCFTLQESVQNYHLNVFS